MMSIFNRITLKNLKNNRTRTIVTIMGVLLSVAMITAVITIISSLQNFMIQNAIANKGDWHAEFLGVNNDFAQKIVADNHIEKVAFKQNIGYVPIKDSGNEAANYMYINALDNQAFESLSLKLLEGRLPENSSELVISEQIKNILSVNNNIGDTLTLEIGSLKIKDQVVELNNGNRSMNTDGIERTDSKVFVQGSTKSYTIVGVCSRPCFEPYDALGYSAITKLDSSISPTDAYFDIFIKLKKPRQIYDYSLISDGNYSINLNHELLRYQGISESGSFNRVLYSLGAILILLIMVGSVLLIYNSFSISVSERTQQFGILASVGATRKQLRMSVLYEGIYIGLVGIPLGIISGLAGISLTLALIGAVFSGLFGGSVDFTVAISLMWLLIAAMVGTLTIMISAYIPARRAAKLSAIEAIRQTADIKITARKIKTSKLARKLFGLEGMLALKNMKRSRKRYRSTVLSLFVSVVLFVSASAFGMYLQQGSANSFENSGYDISFASSYSDTESIRLFEELSNVSSIEESGYRTSIQLDLELKAGILSERYLDNYPADEIAGNNITGATTFFIDDKTYEKYALELGLDPAVYMKVGTANVIALSKYNGYDQNSGRYLAFDIFENPAPIDAIVKSQVPGNDNGISESKRISLTYIADKMPSNMSETFNPYVVLIVPYSLQDQFFSFDPSHGRLIMTFSSSDPKKSSQEMSAIISKYNFPEGYSLIDIAEMQEMDRSLLLVINVFTYGFIILISLITIANVFNTVSTNIHLRKREFAMLKSVGMSDRGFNKMMYFECILYGLKALIYGLPVAFTITYFIYQGMMAGVDVPFALPWVSVGISILSVFLVVFTSMVYAVKKVKNENIVDILKSDMV